MLLAGETAGNITADITSAMQTAFTAVQTDVIDVIKIALPAALVIMGIFIAIRLGVKFFRSTAK